MRRRAKHVEQPSRGRVSVSDAVALVLGVTAGLLAATATLRTVPFPAVHGVTSSEVESDHGNVVTDRAVVPPDTDAPSSPPDNDGDLAEKVLTTERGALESFKAAWRGVVGNHLVNSAEYEASGGAGKVAPGAPNVKKVRRAQQLEAERFALRLHGEQLSRENRVGVASRSKHAFQVVAVRRPATNILFAGRDFEVPASPSASVDYYQVALGVPTIDAVARERVLAEARVWQKRRRELLARLVSLIVESAPRHIASAPPRAMCYAVVRNRVVFLNEPHLSNDYAMAEREYQAEEQRLAKELQRFLER